MRIEEHQRRAEIYRRAAELTEELVIGMCLAISEAIRLSMLPLPSIQRSRWNGPETYVFRCELTAEVGPLHKFYRRMNVTWPGEGSNPDRVEIRQEILTRAAEYHEACVTAGRTLR